MTYKLFLLPAIMAASSLTIAADSINDRVDKLENDIRILKSQNESSQAQAIRFNGFFSVGATSASNNLGYVDSNNRYDFEELTRLGLQASFDIDDSTSVTTQVLGKGSDDFDATMEWAYVSHTFDNDGTLRAGKLRIPFFMYSDFLDVGLAQPWVRPPREAYNSPFTALLGGDYNQSFDLENSTLGFQIYGGQGGAAIAEIDTAFGLAITWSNDNLSLRITQAQLSVTGGTATIALLPSGTEVDFYGLGAIYDNGQLLVVGELVRVDVQGFFRNSDSAYVTLGYRIDEWLPYVTVASTETTDDDKRPSDSTLNFQLDAYSLGAKYNISSSMSIKGDVTHVTNFGDTVGVTNRNSNRAYDDSTVYSIRLDTVF